MELTVEVLRAFVRDNSSLNRVFDGVEFQDSDYAAAIQWGDLEQESIPPFINGFQASELPVAIRRLGALACLFEMASIEAMRNNSNLSEAGVPIPVGENASLYERLYSRYLGLYNDKVHNFKTARNMENAMMYQGSVYGRHLPGK